MTDNRTQVFDVAMKNARTIEACVDRLSMMGADHELKLVAQRLTRLTFRLRHQPSKVRKGWAQPQSSAAWRECVQGPPMAAPQCFSARLS